MRRGQRRQRLGAGRGMESSPHARHRGSPLHPFPGSRAGSASCSSGPCPLLSAPEAPVGTSSAAASWGGGSQGPASTAGAPLPEWRPLPASCTSVPAGPECFLRRVQQSCKTRAHGRESPCPAGPRPLGPIPRVVVAFVRVTQPRLPIAWPPVPLPLGRGRSGHRRPCSGRGAVLTPWLQQARPVPGSVCAAAPPPHPETAFSLLALPRRGRGLPGAWGEGQKGPGVNRLNSKPPQRAPLGACRAPAGPGGTCRHPRNTEGVRLLSPQGRGSNPGPTPYQWGDLGQVTRSPGP